jgi:hypothetical protein
MFIQVTEVKTSQNKRITHDPSFLEMIEFKAQVHGLNRSSKGRKPGARSADTRWLRCVVFDMRMVPSDHSVLSLK